MRLIIPLPPQLAPLASQHHLSVYNRSKYSGRRMSLYAYPAHPS
jgi:hypothetical protein